jgi:hypothetical protein
MGYVNKSGTAALRGISRTGQLDDDGLPAMQWYGADVDTLTARNLIVAVLDAVGFDDLDKAEQAAIVEMICQNVGGKTFQRNAVRRIVRERRP